MPAGGRKRLVVVGDSMVEGQGVELDDTFAARLRTALAADGWDVVGAGMHGGSPAYYAANLPRYLALRPDAVLLVTFENDRDEDAMREAGWAALPPLPAESLLLHDAAAWTRLAVARLLVAAMPYRPTRDEIAFDALIRANRRANRVACGDAAGDAGARTAASARYLDVVAAALAARHVRLFVAALGGTPSGDHGVAEFARRWAASHALPFLSLRDAVAAWIARDGAPAIVIPDDGHLTARAHPLVAEKLGAWLRPLLAAAGADGAPIGSAG